MPQRIPLFMLSFCLAVVLSTGCAHEKKQATATEKRETPATQAKSELTQEADSEKGEPSQAVDAQKREEPQAPAAHEKSEASASKTTEAAPTEGKRVQATGRVRLVGSGPVSELVITGEGKQWYIAKEEMQKLNAFQQQTVTVEGEETIRELRWANGRPAGKRRYLHNIKLMTPE